MRIVKGFLLLWLAIGWVPDLSMADPPEPPATELQLIVGDLQTLRGEGIVRVAIGDPDVADVTVMSEGELLVQAKRVGTTSLILWDDHGQQAFQLTVEDRSQLPSDDIIQQLERMVGQLGFTGVQIKREGEKVFVTGEVGSEEELGRLEQLAASYPDVVTLAVVNPKRVVPPPPPQMVRLGVQVIELDRNFTEKLGVKWSEAVGFTEQSLAVGPSGTASINEALVGTAESFAKRVGEPFRVGRLVRQGVTSTINFLVSHGKGRILAEPTLVTASGKEATSFVGGEIPVISTTSVGVTTGGITATIDFREVGVKLTMTPTVIDHPQKISTALKAEVSTLDTSTAIQVATGTTTVTVPGFKTRRAQTEVVTDSGETILIAGLLQTEDSESVSQLPALGTLPVLGRLFRSPEFKDKRTELVVTVTPELASGEGSSRGSREMAIAQALRTNSQDQSGNRTPTPALQAPTVIDDVTRPSEQAADAASRYAYARTVQAQLAKAMQFPKDVWGASGKQLKLQLHLRADGALLEARIVQPSGLQALDDQALRVAHEQSPYLQFPAQLTQRELWIDVPIVFNP